MKNKKEPRVLTKDEIADNIIDSLTLVTWMGEDDFNEFFKNQLVRYWEIKPEPELMAEMIGE